MENKNPRTPKPNEQEPNDDGNKWAMVLITVVALYAMRDTRQKDKQSETDKK